MEQMWDICETEVSILKLEDALTINKKRKPIFKNIVKGYQWHNS